MQTPECRVEPLSPSHYSDSANSRSAHSGQYVTAWPMVGETELTASEEEAPND